MCVYEYIFPLYFFVGRLSVVNEKSMYQSILDKLNFNCENSQCLQIKVLCMYVLYLCRAVS